MISQCVILVGGLGTRLGGLTHTTPKPLLPVGDKPFLDHLIHRAARFGFVDIVLLAGYLGDQVLERYAGTQHIVGRNVRIRVIVEKQLAGTGGALRYLDGIADERFVLMNGDSWFGMDLRAFAEMSLGPFLARLALRRLDNSGRYGSVVLDGDRIVEFDPDNQGSKSEWINAGIYLMSRALLSQVTHQPCSLERDIFPRMAREGKLGGKAQDGFFIDIGVPDDYLKASLALSADLLRPAVFFDRDGVLNEDDGYTHRLDQLRWIDGAVDAVKAVNAAGWYAFVVTNQAGVGHGHYHESDVESFHHHMDEELAAQGAHIDEYVYCPFHPKAKLDAYRRDSPNRKPKAGMLYEILARWPVDTKRSILLGDKDTDLQAAKAASIDGFLYRGGNLHAFLLETLKSRPLR